MDRLYREFCMRGHGALSTSRNRQGPRGSIGSSAHASSKGLLTDLRFQKLHQADSEGPLELWSVQTGFALGTRSVLDVGRKQRPQTSKIITRACAASSGRSERLPASADPPQVRQQCTFEIGLLHGPGSCANPFLGRIAVAFSWANLPRDLFAPTG